MFVIILANIVQRKTETRSDKYIRVISEGSKQEEEVLAKIEVRDKINLYRTKGYSFFINCLRNQWG